MTRTYSAQGGAIRLLFCLALWIVGGNASANDCALQARASYRNPILDADFPDPTVIETRHGWYFAYATQSVRAGKRINVQVTRSRDLINWQPPSEAMPDKPRWARQTWNFWAPHVSVDDGVYYLYSSA